MTRPDLITAIQHSSLSASSQAVLTSMANGAAGLVIPAQVNVLRAVVRVTGLSGVTVHEPIPQWVAEEIAGSEFVERQEPTEANPFVAYARLAVEEDVVVG